MKICRNTFAIFLTIIMVFGLTGAARAEISPEINEEMNTEIVELREKNSKTYQLPDGTYDCVVYPNNIHYLNQLGEYQEINNAITIEKTKIDNIDYAYKNEANLYTLRFSNMADSSYPVRMEYKGTSLAFGPKEAKNSIAVVPDVLKGNILPDIVDTQCSVLYEDVYDDTDYLYESTSSGVKEYIILNHQTDKNEFTFDIQLEGLSIKEENGNVAFFNEKGEKTFEVGQLFAIDDNESICENVTSEITESEGKKQLKITIDKAFLNDENRAFPVIIDPSITITGETNTYDSFVSSRYPDSNYYLSDYLRTGRDTTYYSRRTFIKFTLPTNIPAENVTSSYLRIKLSSGAAPSVKAYRAVSSWSSSTITWNNMSGYSTLYSSDTAYNDSGSWYRMNVNTMVKNWLNGTYSNYGFMLKDATESGTNQWTTFYASDALSPNKPELHIEFTGYGSRPYEYLNNTSINCAGYALDYADWVNFGITYSGLNTCSNESELWTYTYNKVNSWLSSNMSGQYSSISTYQSYISTGKWRVVLRMGYQDDGDGIVDIDNYSNDLYDFHWWYQSDTGQWAEKMSSLPSNLVSGTNSNTNPYSISWPNFGFSSFYDSSCKYYSISN